jgi:hypothetical protein
MNNNNFSSGLLISARHVALAAKALWLNSNGARFAPPARRHLP